MKAFLLLLLIAICACNSILSEVSNAYLKKHAPFKVYEPSKTPSETGLMKKLKIYSKLN